MNITKAFATFLQNDLNLGTLLVNIFVGGFPSNAPFRAFKIVSGGGSPEVSHITGEKRKNYVITLTMRGDQEDVYNTLQQLEEDINSSGCTEMSGYDIIYLQATLFPTDDDLDAENRSLGTMTVEITTHL